MANENILIKDVELNWAKLASPITTDFGVEQWEIQVAVDKSRAKELEEAGLSVREVDGKAVATARRKTTRRDGSPQEPVRVVDANKAPFTELRSIGNGSKGNVIIFKFDYTFGGREGVSSMLSAIQITDHVVFEGSNAVDFDAVDAEVEGANAPF